MITKTFEYSGYDVELHEHPIYHDFEFVIKSKDGKVFVASVKPFKEKDLAEQIAKETINNL
jgi:hypothetical protein